MRSICYKCGHTWNYKGKQRGKDTLCCSKCSYKLIAEKALVKDLHSNQEELHTYIHSFKGNLHSPIKKLHTTHKPDVIEHTHLFNLSDLKGYPANLNVIQEEEIIIDGIICEIHKLPASYDDLDRKWVCE